MTGLVLFAIIIFQLSSYALEDNRMMPPNPCILLVLLSHYLTSIGQHFFHGSSFGGRSFLYSTTNLRVNFASAAQICSSCFGLPLLSLSQLDFQSQEYGPTGSFWTGNLKPTVLENKNLRFEYEEIPHRILCGENELKCTESGCAYDFSQDSQKRSDYEQPYATMAPTRQTTKIPTSQPTSSYYPTMAPTYQTKMPTYQPTSSYPTMAPTRQTTKMPTYQPTSPHYPTMAPTYQTKMPAHQPTSPHYPTIAPSHQMPTSQPTSSYYPSMAPTYQTKMPTHQPTSSYYPTMAPTYQTKMPTDQPTSPHYPTMAPSHQMPTSQPTSSYYPTMTPSHQMPTSQPTSSYYPSMTPSSQPTDSYYPTPTQYEPTLYPTDVPTESICDNFINVVTATKTYYVSEPFLQLSFQNAASLCKFCWNVNLADISNAVAIIGSPFHDQFWCGSYDQGAYTCNLAFQNHSLSALLDGSRKMRFMCDSIRPAEPSCNGFSKKRADDPLIFSSYSYPTSTPSFSPTRTPTYAPSAPPTSMPTDYYPTYAPTESEPTYAPTTNYPTDSPSLAPTSQTVCDRFKFFVEATKTYYVSEASLRTSFRDAADICATCFKTNLGDISNAVAIVGSPYFENYWVGSYDQGEYTCNLAFLNHSLAALSDGSTSLRVICDGMRSNESTCSGFPVKKRTDGESSNQVGTTATIEHTDVSPTTPSICSKFQSISIGSKNYFVSDPSLRLGFQHAANTCSSCFSRNLADISHSTALAGSPSGEQFWTGSYSNGAYTCNLVFGQNTLAAIEDESTLLRFMCDNELPAQTKCNGFPGTNPTMAPTSSSCQFDPINIGGKSFIISLNSEASDRCATCLNRRLADIPNSVAFISSPKDEAFYVGSYDQSALTCNLLWKGINLNVQADGNSRYRYLCDTTLLPSSQSCLGKK